MHFSSTYYIEGIRVKPKTGQTCTANIRLGSSSWQNPVNRYDIDGDGLVTTEDYTILQEWLDEYGETTLIPVRPESSPYLDVNGDGIASEADLVLLSNFLNNGQHIDYSEETECFSYSALDIHREIMVPKYGMTAKDVAVYVEALPFENYRVYKRSFANQTMWKSLMTANAGTRDSFVFIEQSLFAPIAPIQLNLQNESNIAERVRLYLATNSEILPSRST